MLGKILVRIVLIIFNLAIILVGNKNDLYKEQTVTEDEEKKYANENNIMNQRTSAKTGIGIIDLFKIIGNKMVENIPFDENKPTELKELKVHPKKRKCCG